MKFTQQTVIAAGLRGFFCAGMATILTALFSWSFVASTQSLQWMGSGQASGPAIALVEGPGRLAGEPA
jgi:hypothetical protein